MFDSIDVYLMYLPLFMLLFLIIALSIYVYTNKKLLQELKEDSEDNNVRVKNIIDAVNYNDRKLLENQRYIYDVYEENNSFSDPSTNTEVDDISNNQYYNMMKNYDALISLTK